MDHLVFSRMVLWYVLQLFVSAFVLQIVTAWMYKFKPQYSMALKACFFPALISLVLDVFVIQLAESMYTLRDAFILLLVFQIILVVSAYTWFLGRMLKHPESGPIGLKKGFFLTVPVLFGTRILFKIFVVPLLKRL